MASGSSRYGSQKELPNVSFYENQIPASPNIEYIDDILTKWPGNDKILEENHFYIQWLFPGREHGTNPDAFPFTSEEAQKISKTPKLKKKMKAAFEMMLGFYGMELTKDNQFKLAQNAKERLGTINHAGNHNFNRITRILKALLEFGHHTLMLPWLTSLADLIYQQKLLDHAQKNFEEFWMQTLDAEDQIKLKIYLEKYPQYKQNASKRSLMPTAATGKTNIPTHTSTTNPGSQHKSFSSVGSMMTTNSTSPASSIQNDKPSFDKTNPQKYSKIVAFYKNEIPLPKSVECIKDILGWWKHEDKKLMKNPYYIHWLFPTNIQGALQSDVILSVEDAKIIKETPELKERVLKAFKMMLEFYGMKLKADSSFEYTNLSKLKQLDNKDNPHLKYITRILYALKQLGYKHLMLPWLKYLSSLIYENEMISNAASSMDNYWKNTLDENEKKELNDYIRFREKKSRAVYK